jgi:hypothetical protein
MNHGDCAESIAVIRTHCVGTLTYIYSLLIAQIVHKCHALYPCGTMDDGAEVGNEEGKVDKPGVV